MPKIENLWYEITKGAKSYIVGTLYQYPNHNVKDFIEKLDNTLSLVTENRKKENWRLNIGLIKFDLHETTSDHLNTYLSYCLMPTSILPTRVIDYSATLIDHMFITPKISKGILLQEIYSQTLQIILLISLY